jgi:hypothetical protein
VVLEEWEPGPPEPEAPLDAQLRTLLRQRLRAGYLTPKQIVAEAIDEFAEAIPRRELRELAEDTLDLEIEQLLVEQMEWPKITDCDRLDRAFSELESRGILARQNYWCCAACGSTAIAAEMRTQSRKKRPVRGYTFFDQQSTESAVEGKRLRLNFGATAGGEAEHVAIGREVVAALKIHKLAVKWSGKYAQHIQVKLEWKRRWRKGPQFAWATFRKVNPACSK